LIFEDLYSSFGQTSRLFAEAAIEKRLATASLFAGKIHLAPGPAQNLYCGDANFRQNLVDDAGRAKGNAGGAFHGGYFSPAPKLVLEQAGIMIDKRDQLCIRKEKIWHPIIMLPHNY
jgi:hypothetical protein